MTLILVLLAFGIVAFLLMYASLAHESNKARRRKFQNERKTPDMEFCHAYIVRDFSTNDIKVVPRQGSVEDLYDGFIREVTIAYTPTLASVAIRNPERDKQSGKLDHFSRERGREISGGRLQKLQAKTPTDGEVLVPSLQNLPIENVRASINAFLQQRRNDMVRNRTTVS